MDAIIGVAEFIYSNIIYIGITFLVVLFVIVQGHKIYQETKMNRRLNFKQRLHRNFSTMSLKNLFRKRVVFSIVTFGALLLLAAFLAQDSAPYDDHLSRLTSAEDVIAHHERFEESFYDEGSQQTAIEFAQREAVTLHEGVHHADIHDTVAFSMSETDMHYYEREGTILHEMNFAEERPKEREDYASIGMFSTGGILAVIGTASDDENADRDLILVDVYDIEKRTYETTYTLSGTLSDVAMHNGQLMLIAYESIPFEDSEESLEPYRPRLEIDGEIERYQRFSDMRHIDGTYPDSFVTFSTIDIVSGTYDFETLLTDSEYHAVIDGANMYLATSSYSASEMTEVVRMRAPVEDVDTAVAVMHVVDDYVRRHRVRLVEGSLAGHTPLQVCEDGVFVHTSSEAHHISRFSRMLAEKTSLTLEQEGIRGIVSVPGFIVVEDVNGRVMALYDSYYLNKCNVETAARFDRIFYDKHDNFYLGVELGEDHISMKVMDNLLGSSRGHFEIDRDKEPLDGLYPLHEKAFYDADMQTVYIPMVQEGPTPPRREIEGILALDMTQDAQTFSLVSPPVPTLENEPFTFRCSTSEEYCYYVTPGDMALIEKDSQYFTILD